MDKPISVGDLVAVVGSHCPGFYDAAAGVHFTVSRLLHRNPTCSYCGTRFEGLFADSDDAGDWSIPVVYLKRIPPLGELESEKNDSKLMEPA